MNLYVDRISAFIDNLVSLDILKIFSEEDDESLSEEEDEEESPIDKDATNRRRKKGRRGRRKNDESRTYYRKHIPKDKEDFSRYSNLVKQARMQETSMRCPSPAPTSSMSTTEASPRECDHENQQYRGNQQSPWGSIMDRKVEHQSDRIITASKKNSNAVILVTPKKLRAFGLPLAKGHKSECNGGRAPVKNSWSGKSVKIGRFSGPY